MNGYPVHWLIAGHSLGGGLAAAASVVSNFEADTFNAAGVNYLTVKQFAELHSDITLDINSWQDLQNIAQGLVTSYVVDYDILTRTQDDIILQYYGLPRSIGTRITLDSDSAYGMLFNLFGQYQCHSYYVESLLLSYNFPLE